MLDDHSEHVVIAPHPDDEVIGCFELLKKVSAVAFCSGDKVRRDEAEAAAHHLHFQPYFKGEKQKLSTYLLQVLHAREPDVVWVPDPRDTHPFHQQVTGLVRYLLATRRHIMFGVYSTNMNVPYLKEVMNPSGKRDALNKCYPSQRGLWEHDQRYYLFEGRALWNPTV